MGVLEAIAAIVARLGPETRTKENTGRSTHTESVAV
jgi:hypothetical protein